MIKKLISYSSAFVLGLTTVLGGASISFINNEKTATAAATTIAALSYTYSSSADIETNADDVEDTELNNTKYGSKKEGYNATTGTMKLYASLDGSELRKLEWSKDKYTCSVHSSEIVEPCMAAGKKNLWKSGTTPYFQMDFSTEKYTDVTFTAYIGATKKGLKNFNVAYATGSSSTYTKISGATLSLSDNKVMTKISCSLPDACEDQSTLKIRIQATNLEAVGGGYVYDDATGGDVAINHITITGTKKSSSSSSSSSNSSSSSSSSSSNSSSSDSSSSSSSSSSDSSANSSSSSSSSSSSANFTVKSVSLNKTIIKLEKGKRFKIKTKITTSPNKKAYIKKVRKALTFTSYNKKVAIVNKKGVIKARKKGSASIYIKYQGKTVASCKVTVK